MFDLLQVLNQRDLTLKDFEQTKGCGIKSLKSIANNKRQMKFLQTLSHSQQLIEWLQTETKGKFVIAN